VDAVVQLGEVAHLREGARQERLQAEDHERDHQSVEARRDQRDQEPEREPRSGAQRVHYLAKQSHPSSSC
jgi:hypothetical protein